MAMAQHCSKSGGRLLILAAAIAGVLLVCGTSQPSFAAGSAPTGLRLRAVGPRPLVELHAKEAEVASDAFKIEENEENAKLGAGVLSFVVGLLFPLLGSFNFGLILGSLGYAIANGSFSGFLSKQESGKDLAETADEVGILLTKAGETGVKVVNWASVKVKELQ